MIDLSSNFYDTNSKPTSKTEKDIYFSSHYKKCIFESLLNIREGDNTNTKEPKNNIIATPNKKTDELTSELKNSQSILFNKVYFISDIENKNTILNDNSGEDKNFLFDNLISKNKAEEHVEEPNIIFSNVKNYNQIKISDSYFMVNDFFNMEFNKNNEKPVNEISSNLDRFNFISTINIDISPKIDVKFHPGKSVEFISKEKSYSESFANLNSLENVFYVQPLGKISSPEIIDNNIEYNQKGRSDSLFELDTNTGKKFSFLSLVLESDSSIIKESIFKLESLSITNKNYVFTEGYDVLSNSNVNDKTKHEVSKLMHDFFFSNNEAPTNISPSVLSNLDKNIIVKLGLDGTGVMSQTNIFYDVDRKEVSNISPSVSLINTSFNSISTKGSLFFEQHKENSIKLYRSSPKLNFHINSAKKINDRTSQEIIKPFLDYRYQTLTAQALFVLPNSDKTLKVFSRDFFSSNEHGFKIVKWFQDYADEGLLEQVDEYAFNGKIIWKRVEK